MSFLSILLQFDDTLAIINEDHEHEDMVNVAMVELIGRRRAVAESFMLNRSARLGGAFVLEGYAAHTHKSFFRFIGEDINLLRVSLGIPEQVYIPKVGNVPGLEIVCLALRRMAYPARWVDIQLMFRRDLGSLSRIFKWAVVFMDDRWATLLYWDERRLTCDQLVAYAMSSIARGCPFPNVWGYIDGTFIHCCRPTIGK